MVSARQLISWMPVSDERIEEMELSERVRREIMDLLTEDLIEKAIHGAGTDEPHGILNAPGLAISRGDRSVSLLPDCAVSDV